MWQSVSYSRTLGFRGPQHISFTTFPPRFFSLQVPPAASDPLAFISFSAKGPTVNLAERRSVAIQNVDSTVFVQTDKPIYKPGQKGGWGVWICLWTGKLSARVGPEWQGLPLVQEKTMDCNSHEQSFRQCIMVIWGWAHQKSVKNRANSQNCNKLVEFMCFYWVKCIYRILSSARFTEVSHIVSLKIQKLGINKIHFLWTAPSTQLLI